MPSTAAPDRERERIRDEAQRAHIAEASRHVISQLAMDLLRKRLSDKHATNDRTKHAACTHADKEHAAAAFALKEKHAKETAELENAKFTLFDQFHEKRAVLVVASQAEEQLLAKETKRHHKFIQHLIDEQALADANEQKALRKRIRKYEKTHEHSLSHHAPRSMQEEQKQKIQQAQDAADDKQRQREDAHAKRLAAHNADWNTLKLKLEDNFRLAKPLHREKRAELEGDYQIQVSQQEQRATAIEMRQIKDLETLNTRYNEAIRDAHSTFEDAESALAAEWQRVNEWWGHQVDEAAARRRQIDQDERLKLESIELEEAKKMSAEVQKVAVAIDAETAAAAAEAKRITATATAKAQSVVEAKRRAAAESLWISATWTQRCVPPKRTPLAAERTLATESEEKAADATRTGNVAAMKRSLLEAEVKKVTSSKATRIAAGVKTATESAAVATGGRTQAIQTPVKNVNTVQALAVNKERDIKPTQLTTSASRVDNPKARREPLVNSESVSKDIQALGQNLRKAVPVKLPVAAAVVTSPRDAYAAEFALDTSDSASDNDSNCAVDGLNFENSFVCDPKDQALLLLDDYAFLTLVIAAELLLNSGPATKSTHDKSSLVSSHETTSAGGSSFVHVKAPDDVSSNRNGSPDSFGSDFIEI